LMPTQTTLYWTRAIGLLWRKNNPRRTELKREAKEALQVLGSTEL
jgi:hypothetical protein